jgi:hypothetical protein
MLAWAETCQALRPEPPASPPLGAPGWCEGSPVEIVQVLATMVLAVEEVRHGN